MAFGVRRTGAGVPSPWWGPARRARRVGAAALAVGAVAVQFVAGAAPAHAAVHGSSTPVVQRDPLVPTTPVVNHYPKQTPMPRWQPVKSVWPSGSADALLATPSSAIAGQAARTGKPGAKTQAGGLPVWISTATADSGHDAPAPASVHVTVASQAAAHAAGVNGVLLTLRRGDGAAAVGRVHLTLSYAQFQDAFGGDWSSRVALVALPACAARTPVVAACRVQTPVKFGNNLQARTLEADVTLPAAPRAPSASANLVLAATSTTSSSSGSGGGDYTATSLKAAGSWQAGGSTDAFTWTYPIPVPSVPGNLAPQVELAYNSQAVDGLNSATNNQASQVGDGWTLPESYIERSYASCHQNPAGSTQTYDNCWSANNTLTLSLNGQTSTLIQDDTSGHYHPANDSNESVQYLTGATNGTHNGDYWVITTPDGTQYWFGYNRLPGWASGNATTNSVDTEPVYYTVSGQSCYNATFSLSWCQQAYRWNLDYVVDTHQDAASYWYTQETNYYAQDLGTTAPSTSVYTRASYLWKIQYGQRAGQVYSTTPAGQVSFTVNGRCNTLPTGCATSTLTSSSASSWPDVPYDLNCASGAACSSQSPSFWSENEVTGIQTLALVGSTLTAVDSWALTYNFPTIANPDKDTSEPSLWLATIQHTGLDPDGGGSTTAVPLPAVSFTGQALQNRAVLTNGMPWVTRQRLQKIITETGETISVNYSAPGCSSSRPSDDSHNTMLCYPVYWYPTNTTTPTRDYFNKYIVNVVTEQDGTGGSVPDVIQTTYTPVGDPAWHYNDSLLTPANQRTWDQWRGYQGMTVTTGTGSDPVTDTTYTYFRGMNGDYLSPTSARSATVGDSRGDPAVTDANQYAGMTYETKVFNGAATVSDTIDDPWSSSATATHALSGGIPSQQSFITGVADRKVYTPLASGATRETESDFTHDAYGRVTRTNDQGDVSTTADDLCTTISYADSTTAWILNKQDETKTVSVNCSTTPVYPANAVSDTQTYYDGSTTLGAAPTVGDGTMTKQAASYTGSTPNYVTTSTNTVDQYGRTTASTDPDNRKTSTSYTPATGAEPTSITITDPRLYTATTTYDALRGLALTKTDVGGFATTEQYDALGRLTAVHLPGVSTSQTYTYTYTVSNTAPSIVDTYTLNDAGSGYHVSESIYDSLLRVREVQTQTPDNSRDITDTYYNSDGWISESTDAYNDGLPVSTTYVQGQPGKVPSATGYTYDGAGRKTATIAYSHSTETWRTSYIYGGNFTTTVPPAGAAATTSVTDARGRQSDLIEYHAGVPTDYVNDPASDYSDTRYTYTPSGKQATETDAAGNSWSWTYNLLGQQTDAYDPDSGHMVDTYDNAGQLLTATDARGKQITTTHDLDGRTTATYDTTATQTLSSANQLTGYVYDTLKKGYPTSTTSYSNGDTYTSTIQAYNAFAKPEATKVTLTGTDAALLPAGGYTTSYGYSTAGRLSGQGDPTLDGLPQENIGYGADAFGEPTGMTSTGTGASTYVSSVGYSEFGQPLVYTLPSTAGNVTVTEAYDPQTHALTNVTTQDGSGTVDALTYNYGTSTGPVSPGAGLLTSTVDSQNNGAAVDTQCYAYDYATRIQQAWTATDSCTATPATGSSSTVGGTVAPYWQSWTYDAAGDRLTQTDHDVTGNTANDTTTTYNYPTAGSATDQPHTLTNTTATGPNAAQNTASYSYDASGDTTGTSGGVVGTQTLVWNDQGKLQSDTAGAGATNYVYDASGDVVVRRDPGSTTLYLGDAQLTLTGTTLSGVRYYTLGGATIAERTSGGQVYYLVPDRQGTDELAISAGSTQTVTRRQYLPFGQARGTAPTWIGGDKGYVGGDTDSATGLETLGARDYSPVTGRFLSADPVLESTDPTQLSGYDYAGNDPVTQSDPTGKMLPADGGGGGDQPQPPVTISAPNKSHNGDRAATNSNGIVYWLKDRADSDREQAVLEYLNEQLKTINAYGENGFVYWPVRQLSPKERAQAVAAGQTARRSDFLRVSYVNGLPVAFTTVDMIEIDTPGKADYSKALRDKTGQGTGVKSQRQAQEVVGDVGPDNTVTPIEVATATAASDFIDLTSFRIISRKQGGGADLTQPLVNGDGTYGGPPVPNVMPSEYRPSSSSDSGSGGGGCGGGMASSCSPPVPPFVDGFVE
jgi:RHS repeat-associated protein